MSEMQAVYRWQRPRNQEIFSIQPDAVFRVFRRLMMLKRRCDELMDWWMKEGDQTEKSKTLKAPSLWTSVSHDILKDFDFKSVADSELFRRTKMLQPVKDIEYKTVRFYENLNVLVSLVIAIQQAFSYCKKRAWYPLLNEKNTWLSVPLSHM